MSLPRIYLSPPHMGPDEFGLLKEAFASNWIAPLGPQVDAFEREFAETVGSKHAAALSSGTAALHLALKLVGVRDGDEVVCSTFTFVASANPIVYERARPVFIDSEERSWNMDPNLLGDFLEKRATAGRLPKALVLVHIYGQAANIAPILKLCDRYGVAVVEDAAEALGATYGGRVPGTFGKAGIFSFNGNKIITTSGGGMLVSEDEALVAQARMLASQARDLDLSYQHSQIGYNYRLSNLLAAVGRGQLRVLQERVRTRRQIFDRYVAGLGDLDGVSFMPEAEFGRCSRWLTCILIDASKFGTDWETVRLALEAENIDSRPVWKPLHLQPVFQGYERVGGEVAERLFRDGLCLPSGSSLSEEDQARVIAVIRRMAGRRK